MNNASLFETLNKARADKTLVALYANPDSPRTFVAGWVEAVTSEHVVLRQLTPHGRYDGYVLQYLERVLRIDTSGRYLERLNFLFTARKESFPVNLLPNLHAESNLMIEILAAARRLDLLVAIEIAADEVEVGAVKAVSSDAVTIEVLDLLGALDGESTAHLEAISEVRCDDERLQSLKLLSRWHQLEPPGW